MKLLEKNVLTMVILAALLTPRAGRTQSTFIFSNYSPPVNAPVFDASGGRLSGTNYVAVLYGGPSPDSLQLGSNPVPFTFMPNGLTGYFRGSGSVEFDTVPCGGFAWLQVRAWDARLGSTYDDVVRLGLGGYGESNLFQAQGGNACPILPGLPNPLIGLQPFSLLPEVPEPGTLLLLFLGLPLLLLRRSR